MSNTLQKNGRLMKTTATNFDLPSLYLLHNEIKVTLQNAETHLSEFNDDSNQALLLLDSTTALAQVSNVLDLLFLKGASLLALALSEGFQHLYDHQQQNNHELIMDISEGIMILNRYIEFVLLKETVEYSLILPIINQLHRHLAKPEVTATELILTQNRSLVISNPEKNYQSLMQLGISNVKLTDAYRAGLLVALTAKQKPINEIDLQKLRVMQASCEAVASRSDSLFWLATVTAVSDLADALPLTDVQKRALIFVEQQFNNYLPVNDARFADLVSFACQRHNDLSQKVQQKYIENRLDETQVQAMKRFLFGPNREVTDTVHQLIQEEIDEIKKSCDSYGRQDTLPTNIDERQSMLERLNNLSLVFKTLNLKDISDILANQVALVKNWTEPTPEDFDSLLNSLMLAENSAIFLAKSHTPGAITLPLCNQNISLHQLDSAYATLIRESRSSIANIESAFNDYLADEHHDIMNLVNVPEMIRNIAGACLFLDLPQSHQLLKRTSPYVDMLISHGNQGISETHLAKIADILMAVDYYLESLETNKPAGLQAIKMGQKSLQQLMAA